MLMCENGVYLEVTTLHYEGLGFLDSLGFFVCMPFSCHLHLDLAPPAFCHRHLGPSADDGFCASSSHQLAGINYLPH